jgi:para-aminobenzoate synthetase component 1
MTLTRRVFDMPYHEAADMFARFYTAPYSLFFDSSDQAHPDGRYSFIAFDPVDFSCDKIPAHDNIHIDEKHADPRPPAPFCGGLAGMFGYDLSYEFENLDREDIRPTLAMGLYTNVIAYDHSAKKTWLIIHLPQNDSTNANPSDSPSPFIKLCKIIKGEQSKGDEEENRSIFTPQWTSNFTQNTYEAAVQKVIDYIRAGDVFQANIAQTFTATLPDGFCAYAHYKYLRTVNPAPFAAYMHMGKGRIIASSSPERFLHLQSGQVTTKPIKGTMPRGDTSVQDEDRKQSLLNSVKNRAENTMIVDLLRNDLSKTCTPDSVQVDKLCAIESFAGLHHLVSTVSGTLQSNKQALDLLRACFPGGSITGAPKIRAMEIIEELEGARRGPYCGALAYIDFNGDMDSNILIRTLIYERGKLCFSVGGGITLNSDPAEEYEETLVKASKIFRSFE